MASEKALVANLQRLIAETSPAAELEDEIRSLSELTLGLEPVLSDIEGRLTSFSKEDAGIPLDFEKFLTRWKHLGSTYGNVVWKTRKLAGKAYKVASDFRETMMSFILDGDQIVDLEQKAEAVEKYLKTVDQDLLPAREVQDEFRQFTDDLDSFKNDWVVAVQATLEASTQEQLKACLLAIENKEKELNAVLQRIQGVSEAVTKLSTNEESVTGFISTVVPSFFAKLVSKLSRPARKALFPDGDTIDKLLEKRNKLGAELDAEQMKAAKLLEGDNPARKSYDELAAAASLALTKVNTVVNKLSKFSDVGPMIRYDLTELVEMAERLKKGPEKIEGEIMKTRLSTMEGFYESLCNVLYVFQSKVVPDTDIPQS